MLILHDNDTGKTATGSAEFVVDLELADEAEVSVPANKRKRRDVQESTKNGAAGECVKGVEVTEKGVDSEEAQVADHRES
jgi:hypothetical protein